MYLTLDLHYSVIFNLFLIFFIPLNLELYGQEFKDNKGFQYDHIWPILKDVEKWADPTLSKTDFSEGLESNSINCINLNMEGGDFNLFGDD